MTFPIAGVARCDTMLIPLGVPMLFADDDEVFGLLVENHGAKNGGLAGDPNGGPSASGAEWVWLDKELVIHG